MLSECTHHGRDKYNRYAPDIDLDFEGPRKAKRAGDVVASTYLGHLCKLQGSNYVYLEVQAQTRQNFARFSVSK